MKCISTRLALWLLTLAVLSVACRKELSKDSGPEGPEFDLNIHFRPVVDALPLEFNTPYQNFFGESYSVQAFKFYISRIDLVHTAPALVYHTGAEHFLVDAADTKSTIITLKAGARKYNRLVFTIGVDSARNFSGAQTGALDPARGMFWTWNSGYIMAKMEGSSPLSTQPDNRFEYHIGGFKDPVNVLKKVELSFPLGQEVEFLPGTTSTIEVTTNLNAWFHEPNDLRIAAHPVCMTPGVLAKQIADNYSKMFTVVDVITN